MLRAIGARQVSILGPLDYETNALPLRHDAYQPFNAMLRAVSPSGDRTLNSGFKDRRDGHFTNREDAIRVPYFSAQ